MEYEVLEIIKGSVNPMLDWYIILGIINFILFILNFIWGEKKIATLNGMSAMLLVISFLYLFPNSENDSLKIKVNNNEAIPVIEKYYNVIEQNDNILFITLK